MRTKSYYRLPDPYRIPDKTRAKAELAELMADYNGSAQFPRRKCGRIRCRAQGDCEI